jgi:hypothetical protein
LRGLLEPVLDQQVQVIPLIEDLAADVGVELHQASHLAVLLGDELLVQRRDLDVDVEFGKIEVRREPLRGSAPTVPVDVERRGFVVPRDLVEVEQLPELSFTVVCEANEFVRKRVASVCLRLCRALRYS